MNIEYELTLDDILDFNMYHFYNSKKIKKTRNKQRYLGGTIFLILPLIMKQVTSIPITEIYPSFIICSLLWIIFYPIYFKNSIKKNVHKMLAKGSNEGIIGEHTFSITDEGIVDKNEFKESKISTKGIKKICQTEKNILIYIGKLNAFIIPFRAFDNENNKEKFLDKLHNLTN